MKAVVQRVLSAHVDIDGITVSEIGRGLLIFVGFEYDDTFADAEAIVNKCIKLRIFDDESGSMNLSVNDIDGSILVVSQFTLLADCKKGNRPSYVKAASSNVSKPLYDCFLSLCKERFANTRSGVFGADMKVGIINDGPVTILLDSSCLTKKENS